METPQIPHVLMLPFPAQGHIKPMLRLAELLCRAGFQITFINSDHNHDKLKRFSDLSAFYDRFPSFRFKSIPDGLPPDHPRSGPRIIDLLSSTRNVTKPEFRELLISVSQERGRWGPPICIIADGIMSFAVDVAEEIGIPVISFRTNSACCTWTYFHLSKLVEEGRIPVGGDGDMDQPVTCIPGLENLLRFRDLPSICRREAGDPVIDFFINETSTMARASALILDTFDGLEAPMISKLGLFFNKIYTIGPLHALLKSCITKPLPSASSSTIGSLWKEDRSCLKWLDSQPLRSVIYVSFGSVVGIVPDQLLEFWYGLVNSGKPFLWVKRPDMIVGEKGVGEIPAELEEGTKERGCIVGWAPQEEVLEHPAVGGFLTQSGWNSTLESIFAGVPMLCWPRITDQQVNSRCVSELWKIGFDMKDKCDRLTIEKMVRDLMEDKREEIMKSTIEIAGVARDSVKEDGSSYRNFEKLVEDIRSMRSTLGP